MIQKKASRICIVPQVSGVGGMVSFRHKLAAGLTARGVDVCHDLTDFPYQAVLVIGGTRQLSGLRQVKSRGIPVIQRLDGMNWMHRLQEPGVTVRNLRFYLRSEYGNLVLRLIRSRLASRIVYQSQFVRGWWEERYGAVSAPGRVIYNAVDLQKYNPRGSEAPPDDHCLIQLVEGNLAGGYELGLDFAVQLAEKLSDLELPYSSKRIELRVVGKAADKVRRQVEGKLQSSAGRSQVGITWFGLAGEDQIPGLDRSAHLLYSADINSACPNSVIEAVACGLPVLAFATGALPELVNEHAGRVVPYGGNPWRLESPDFPALAVAAQEIVFNRERFSAGARQRAEQTFDIQKMIESYLAVLFEG